METQTPELTVLLAAQGFLLLIAKHTPELVQRNPRVQALVKHTQGLADKLETHSLVNLHGNQSELAVIMQSMVNLCAKTNPHNLAKIAAYIEALAAGEVIEVSEELGNKLAAIPADTNVRISKMKPKTINN